MRYTRKLEKLVEQLSRVMTLLDVAELTALNWDTVKDIVKRRLRRDYGGSDFKGVRYLSIDEISFHPCNLCNRWPGIFAKTSDCDGVQCKEEWQDRRAPDGTKV